MFRLVYKFLQFLTVVYMFYTCHIFSIFCVDVYNLFYIFSSQLLTASLQLLLGKCSGNVWEISRNCPGMFREISGKFRKISGKNIRRVWEKYRKVQERIILSENLRKYKDTVHGKKIPPRVFGHNSAPWRLPGTRIGGNFSYRSPGAF